MSTRAPDAPPRRLPELPHPRIRARRIEVQRDEGRRRLTRLVVLCSVVAVVLVAGALTRSPALDVDRVTVTGAGRTGAASVQQTSGIANGTAMIDVDGAAAARAVEALPWVARAEVTRLWPGTVRIRVAEREPIAQVVGARGISAVVDRTGRVLEVRPAPAPGLPHIEGLAAGGPGTSLGAGAEPLLGLAAHMSPRLSAAVTAIGRDRTGVTVSLDDGSRAQLGPPQDLDDKLVALDAMVTGADRPCPIDRIDVRVPSAPVLTYQKGCA